MEDLLSMLQLLCGISLAAGILAHYYSRSHPLDHIPAIGCSGLLGSYRAAFKYLTGSGVEIVQQGFDKYENGVFKVSTLHGWVVYLNPKHIEEVAKLPTDVMSFQLALNDIISAEYTFGPQALGNPYHVMIIRTRVTRNLSILLPVMKDEMIAALNELFDMKPNVLHLGNTSVPVVDSCHSIISRMMNRAIVGVPLCRDPDWLDLTMQGTMDATKEGFILGVFPYFLMPLAAKFITTLSSRMRRGTKHLEFIIKERQRCMREHGGEWKDKPNDILQWCIEDGDETTVPLLTSRMLLFVFGGMRSTSSVLAKILCLLATNPECVKHLRKEVEMAIEQHGWTREGIAQMRVVDSFIKETVRFEGIGASGILRKTVKDVTLSDGTFLPRGTSNVVAAYAIEHDPRNYTDPFTFDPFRFVDLQDKCGDTSKYQFTSISHDLLAFGIGKSACPGRFWASMMLKTLFAYIVMTYDVKPGEDLPASQYIHGAISTKPSTKLLFRKRVDVDS